MISQNENPSESNNYSKIKYKLCNKYTSRQWRVFAMMCCCNLCGGLAISIIAPFFPKLASKKDVNSTMCGFIFASYELIIFIISPILGRNVRTVGGKWLLIYGIGIIGISKLSIGFLEMCPPGIPFIGASFLIIMIEGCGQASYRIGAFVTIGQEFPEDVSSSFSILETAYGFGQIIGPTVGSKLYEIGGFIAPYSLVSLVHMITIVLVILILPSGITRVTIPGGFIRLLQFPGVLLSLYTVASCAFTYGFNLVLLEPFLRQFNLSPIQMGLVFLIDGVTFLGFSSFWGYLAGNKINISPKILNGTAATMISLGYLFLGPVVFFPFDSNLWVAVVSLIAHGIGGTGQFICTVIDCRQEAILGGYPHSIETSGLVSGLWFSVYAIGNLIGHSAAGVLNDNIGFRQAVVFVVVLELFAIVFNFGLYFRRKISEDVQKMKSEENLIQLKTSYPTLNLKINQETQNC